MDETDDHETLDDVAAQALEEMDYRDFEGDFGQQQSVSIPCQLHFTDEPEQRIEKFHMALEVHDFSPLDYDPGRTMDGRKSEWDSPYYDGEICSTEHYNRIRVLVFRGNVIRIFPHDGYIPDPEELAKLLHAITIGFRSDLEHAPIDDTRSAETGGEING